MKTVLFGLVLFLVVGTSVYAQQAEVSDVKTIEYSDNTVLAEKLYIHTDRDSYQPGDTIFLRGFLFSAINNSEIDLSRVIYVDLVDRAGVLYWREMIEYNYVDSTLSGHFVLADNLSQGEYFLRAYTYWMQEQGEESFYSKRIFIVNPFDNGILCDLKLVKVKNGKRTLRVAFTNKKGEAYQNVKFNYFIPGENLDSTMYEGDTGYNAKAYITINDSLSDNIWISISHDSPWSFEGYYRLPGTKLDFDVKFFPEGGDLILGELQKIAFKSIGRDGMSVPVKGYVENSSGVKLFDIQSNHMGIGAFEIKTDVKRERLYAVLSNGEGSVKRFSLPMPVANSEAIIIRPVTGNMLMCNVLGNTLKLSSRYLVIIKKGVPIITLRADSIVGRKINLSAVAEGVLTFMLLDSKGRIYSSRKWYNHHNHGGELLLEATNLAEPRNEQKLMLDLRGVNSAQLSVSVISEKYTTHLPTTSSISTYVNLSSDVKGFVEEQEYYLKDRDTDSREALDNLLLTQGWERYRIDDTIKNRSREETLFFVERGQYISGSVKGYWGRKNRGAYAHVSMVGVDGSSYKTIADSLGKYLFNDVRFDIGTRFFVQAISQKGKTNVELYIDEPKFLTTKIFVPIGICKGDAAFFDKYGVDYIYSPDGSKVQTIGEIRVGAMSMEAQKREFWDDFEEYSSRLHFMAGSSSVADYGMGLNGDRHYFRRLEWAVDRGLSYYAPGAVKTFTASSSIESIPGMTDAWLNRWYNIEQSGRAMNGQAPRIVMHSVIDDVEYDESQRVNDILLSEQVFELQEEMVTPSEYPTLEYQFNIQTVIPFAPQPQDVQFYKPKYNVPLNQMINDPIDAKATRYWNHKVVVRNGEPFEFSFPTAADSRAYTVVVNGVDNNGNPIGGVWRIEN